MAATATASKNAARPSTRAQVRYVRMSASKARQVLDLIRGKSVADADDILALSERDAGQVIQKVLRSAVANAEHNDGLDPEELFVSTCFADEGPTLRRFRPRARGRATRIRKRTCHITVIVSRYDADELQARRERERARGTSAGRRDTSSSRRRRVARSRGEEVTEETVTDEVTEDTTDESPTTMAEEAAGTAAEGAETVDEAVADAEETTDEVAEDEAPAEESDEAAEAESPEDLVEGHTKDELLEMADEAGVDVAKSATKAEIAAAIEAGTATAEELAEHHSKDELLEIAEKAGVEAAKSWTKPQIAEAIVAARGDD
jgi:large subunit ribosomal protein L22